MESFSKFINLTMGLNISRTSSPKGKQQERVQDCTGSKMFKDKEENNEDDVDTDIFNGLNTEKQPEERRKKKLKRKNPKPSNVQYDSSSSNSSETKKSIPSKIRRNLSRRPIRNSDTESSPSKRPRSESPKSSSTGEEIHITASQHVVKNKKTGAHITSNGISQQRSSPKKSTPLKDINNCDKMPQQNSSPKKSVPLKKVDNCDGMPPENSSPKKDVLLKEVDNCNSIPQRNASTKGSLQLNEVDNPSQGTIFFSMDNQSETAEKQNDNVNVGNANVARKNNIPPKKKVKRTKCSTICQMIDAVQSKKHPLHKSAHLFTHWSLKKLSNREFLALKKAMDSMAQPWKK